MSDINYIACVRKADVWMQSHTISKQGIAVTSKQRRIYPEVTGYYIPTLLRWGYRDIALRYAQYLSQIQREDGAWCAIDKISPYVFDTGQVIKGLLAVSSMLPNVKDNIIRGCDWIISNIQESGRLTTPSGKYWSQDGTCSELIHLYCLSPLIEAGNLFDREDYIAAAQKVLSYYKKNHMDEIMNFKILSHFYAYIMEALLDLGEEKLVKMAMDKVAKIQRKKGYIPAYRDVEWLCSTGVFQLALVWYRLGDSQQADRAFDYACQLQNESGGWYGGYTQSKILEFLCPKKFTPTYFPREEISWAVKYFLDAFYERQKSTFEMQAETFLDRISKKDERYQFLLKQIQAVDAKVIGDIGCGKGRYLKKLTEDLQNVSIRGVDLSWEVMKQGHLIPKYEVKVGSVLQIPYPDAYFDLVYTAEVLEHAVHITNAIRELMRVLKPGGKLLIIDKNRRNLGQMQLDKWEQWFDPVELAELIAKQGGNSVEVVENVGYQGRKDGLFTIWTAIKESRDEQNTIG